MPLISDTTLAENAAMWMFLVTVMGAVGRGLLCGHRLYYYEIGGPLLTRRKGPFPTCHYQPEQLRTLRALGYIQ